MEKIYYLNVNKKNIGPFTKEDIKSKIANGALNNDSFIYIKGDKNWVLLNSIPCFKDCINNVSKNIIKRWYIHKNKKNFGPYSISDLISLLEKGEFDIDDYTWSKGLDNWTQLRNLNELYVKKDELEEQTELSLEENFGKNNININQFKQNKENTNPNIFINENSNDNLNKSSRNIIAEEKKIEAEYKSKENKDDKDIKKEDKKNKKIKLKKEKSKKEKTANDDDDIEFKVKKKQIEKKLQNKKLRKIKLMPELFLAIVLIYFALLIDKKLYSLYLFLGAFIIFFIFIFINIFLKRKVKKEN
jgi:hypothetical protein